MEFKCVIVMGENNIGMIIKNHINMKQKYMTLCGNLFTASVELTETQKRALKTNSATANQKLRAAEQNFLSCCKQIEDEYNMTNPKTIEVEGLLQFMVIIKQGHNLYP